MKSFYLLLASVGFAFSFLHAEDKIPVRFGKVTSEDFNLSAYRYDSGASAVIVADLGNSSFEGNTKGWFTLVFKHQVRIKILNKNGFEAANIQIPLYFSGNAEEKLDNLKAVTYNLENGKVVETKLEMSAVFKDKLSKNLLVKKFTFPAVKEGSIIEYSYTVNSDFLQNLQPWAFQGDYPRIWSEYQVEMPDFFNYVYLAQGYNPFYIHDTKSSYRSFQVSEPTTEAFQRNENYTFSADVKINRWVMKDIPALKAENFTSTVRNHISKIEFQLSQYRFPNMPVKDIMGNWKTVTEEMMKDETFGATLAKNNNWLDDDLKLITAGATSDLEKARKIYAFLRDNFTCTDESAVYLSATLKNIFKARNGNVADINLLLTAMLLHEGIKAEPLILSTREHGLIHEMYPLMDRFNYVITLVTINGTQYPLDASEHELGFGRISNDCYNGTARVIGEAPGLVQFLADSLMETKITSVYMINDEKGGIKGRINSSPGYYESLSVREEVKESGKESYLKSLRSQFPSEMNIQNADIDSLKKLEDPVMVHVDFTFKPDEDILYFNPLMGEGMKENLFKAAERKYPVEMPYAFNKTYVLTMEIPKNYTVEELPKSAKVVFNEGEGLFEYLISKTADLIQFRSTITLKKAYFMPEEYESLREFMGYVVKKHSEQIVFKKTKP